jgi:hypothetical protein
MLNWFWFLFTIGELSSKLVCWFVLFVDMQLQWQPLLAPECKLLDLRLVPLFSHMYWWERDCGCVWRARVCPRAWNIRGSRVRAWFLARGGWRARAWDLGGERGRRNSVFMSIMPVPIGARRRRWGAQGGHPGPRCRHYCRQPLHRTVLDSRRRPFSAAPLSPRAATRQMHLRRCIFTSPLSSKAKCLALLPVLVEREFVRYMPNGDAKMHLHCLLDSV